MTFSSAGWKETSLGDICTFKYGKSLPHNSRKGGEVPVYGSNGIVGHHDSAITVGKTIVVGRKGSYGEVNYSTGACWPIDTAYFIDETATEQDIRWLSYRLANLGLNQLNKAAAIPGLNRDDAYRQKLLVPPIPEQRRIAAILNQIDKVRGKRREALSQLEDLTQSIFVDMFGNPVQNERGWEIKRLALAVEGKYGVKAGPFGSSLKKEDYSESGYRVYGQEQVIAGRFDVGNYYIDDSKFKQLQSCAVSEGDLLVSLVGSFGKVLIVPHGIEPGIINPRLLKITPNKDLIEPFFLAQLIGSKAIQDRLINVSHGGTMGILNAGLIKDLEVILPPLKEQRKFALQIKALLRVQTINVSALTGLNQLFASVQHRAFRGEL